MSIIGVVLAVLGILAAFFGLIAGVIGGGIAAVLGIAAVVLGFLSLKKQTGKGKGAIITGVVAIVLAIALTISGINLAKQFIEYAEKYGDQYTAETKNESLMKKYASKMDTKYGLIGFLISASNDSENLLSEGDQALADRITKEMDFYYKLAEKEKASPTATQNTVTPAEQTETTEATEKPAE